MTRAVLWSPQTRERLRTRMVEAMQRSARFGTTYRPDKGYARMRRRAKYWHRLSVRLARKLVKGQGGCSALE